MIILDTSALVRFFVADDKQKAKLMANLLSSKEDLFISEAVLAELTYVLAKLYQSSKAEIVKILRFLISRPNVIFSDEIKLAAKIFSEENISIVDSLILAYAQTSQGSKVASFDKKLIKLSNVKSYWNQ